MDEETPRIVSDSIRYRDKAVFDREWIVEFLASQETGVLGLVDDGDPYLVTRLFVHVDDESAIYLHGANAGRTHDIVAEHDGVRGCFTTSRTGRFVPADEPVSFTVEYESVVADGHVSLLEDVAAKRRVLERFMRKFAPQLSPDEDYEVMSEDSVDPTAIYRFDVETWSAKRGEKPDHPGAYDLDSVREAT